MQKASWLDSLRRFSGAFGVWLVGVVVVVVVFALVIWFASCDMIEKPSAVVVCNWLAVGAVMGMAVGQPTGKAFCALYARLTAKP